MDAISGENGVGCLPQGEAIRRYFLRRAKDDLGSSDRVISATALWNGGVDTCPARMDANMSGPAIPNDAMADPGDLQMAG